MNQTSSEELVKREKRYVCPYNSSHLVDPLRMAIHLVKCKKAYPHIKMKVCPFNATHHVREENLTAHLEQCKDKSIVEKSLFYRKNPKFLERHNSLPSSSSFASRDGSRDDFPLAYSRSVSEDWDKEIENSVSYNPERNIIYKEVSRLPPSGLGKSARRRWREVEELRIRRLKEGIDIHDLVYPTGKGDEISIAEIVGEESSTEAGAAAAFGGRDFCIPKPNPVMRADQPVRRPHNQSRIAADIFGKKNLPVAAGFGWETTSFDSSKGAARRNCDKEVQELEEAVETLSLSSLGEERGQARKAESHSTSPFLKYLLSPNNPKSSSN